MHQRFSIRLYFILTTMLACSAGSAFAQFQPRTLNDPATGEDYHIEGSAGYWFPTATMSISSESLGIPGSTIDFKNDLGLKDKKFGEVQLVYRPGVKHKLRLQYIPIEFKQDAVLVRNVVFNGQLYNVGLPVKSALSWKAYRFAYQYDFVSKNRGFGGFILETKYTDVQASLQALRPNLTVLSESALAKVPIPAIGGIVRVYVVPNISITAEISGIAVPESLSPDYNAHYADLDIYGTVNITNKIGAKVGYRSFDVGYTVEKDIGNFILKGAYIGIVARY